MEYNYNQIQDFLDDDSFVRWTLFGQDKDKWVQFLIDHPMKASLMNEASEFILEINEIQLEPLDEFDQQKIWSRINQTLKVEEVSQETVELRLWQRPFIKWVACIIILFGIGSLVWTSNPDGQVSYHDLLTSFDAQSTLIERINTSDIPLKVQLEDGSVIVLEKNSKLSYPVHFNKNSRTVILSGDAFFEIAKDPNKPFYVYANEIVTKVLGTSFRIRAFDNDEKLFVKVSTGRVSVFNQRRINLSDPETNGLVLVPNQQAIYNRSDENLSKKLVESPVVIAKESPTEFNEAPINKVFDAIENRYGIKIIYNEEVLASCTITTKLIDKSLYDQLDLICKIIAGTYKEVDSQIVIESQGCTN